MSHIGEYVSISATNAGAIIDALTAQLREAQSMKDYYCNQVVQLTAETEAQAAEIKRLQGELETNNAKPDSGAHKYSVGDRVQAHGGLVGIIQAVDSAYSNFPYLVKWHGGDETWAGINSLSPAPSEAPDAALPPV